MLNNIDHTICISLKEREDRRILLTSQLKKLNLNIEYLLADKDKENPVRGCFNSHQACAKIALERNYKNILILEDDVTFDENISPKKLINADRFIKKYKPDIFYLGSYTWGYVVNLEVKYCKMQRLRNSCLYSLEQGL